LDPHRLLSMASAKLIESLDLDGDDKVSQAEFLEISNKMPPQIPKDQVRTKLESVFSVSDKDGDGNIDMREAPSVIDELRTLLDPNNLLASLTPQNVFDFLDTDGNGKVSKAELSAKIPSVFPPDQVQIAVQLVFSEVDADGDGIDMSDLAAAVDKLMNFLDPNHLLAMVPGTFISVLDKDDDEKVSRFEFYQISHLVPPQIPKDQVQATLQEVFSASDKDGDGNIDMREAQLIIEKLKEFLDPNHLLAFLARKATYAIIDFLDTDKNGKISKEEFRSISGHVDFLQGVPIPELFPVLDYFFTHLDANGDKALSAQEIPRVVGLLSKLLEDANALLDEMTPESLFRFLDSDSSGTVEEAELVALSTYSSMLPIGLEPEEAKILLTNLFNAGDKNRDDKLTLEEMVTIFETLKSTLELHIKAKIPHLCFSKEGDSLRPHVTNTGNHPLPVLKLLKAESCVDKPEDDDPKTDKPDDDDEKKGGGCPRCVGFATVFSLIVARCIAF